MIGTSDLIEVKNNNGGLLVSARELHEGLEIDSKFNDWFNRMLKYGFEEELDYISIAQKKVTAQGNKSEYKDYILKLDMAKEIAMLQRNEKGKIIRKYFIECERQLKETKPKLPTTYKEALIALVQEIEAKEEAEKQRDKLIHQNKLYNTTEIAKELGFKSATALNKDLAERRIQYKTNNTWVLCSEYANRGYTSIKQTELESGRIIYDRKWSGSGRDFILSLYTKEQGGM